MSKLSALSLYTILLYDVTQYGSTALMWASENGYTELANLLIDHGANVNAVDKVSIINAHVWYVC